MVVDRVIKKDSAELNINTEESHSGLVHCLGKAATGQLVREFESLLLRKYKNVPLGAVFVCGGEQANCFACVRDSKPFSLMFKRCLTSFKHGKRVLLL